MSLLPVPSIHLITSRGRLSPDARTVHAEIAALEAFVDEAIDAGVDVVQIRERDLAAALLYDVVNRVMARARTSRTRVLVSERADVAAAARAAGVHLPSTGMSASRMRQVDPGWIIGRSIHAGDVPVDRTFADYLLFGTVFPSESKPAHATVAGIEGLRAAVAATGRPVVAIGGVTPTRARECLAAGASGVAAIGAFLPPGRARGALGPRAAIAAFKEGMGASPSSSSPQPPSLP